MSELRGEWRERSQVWHDVRVANCDVCGRLLLRRVWRFADPDFGELDSCEPECERLWVRYVRPRRLAAGVG
ncbi:MAG TPA: hypothetical protein VFB25_03455 [Gaiellaceae bacterium]|nr:hypothetical protein [Gaiellaceae bacterium]